MAELKSWALRKEVEFTDSGKTGWEVYRILWQAKKKKTTRELYAMKTDKVKGESLEFLRAVTSEIHQEKHVLSML